MAIVCTPDDVRALDLLGTDFPIDPYTDGVLQRFIDRARCLFPDDNCGDPECLSEALCHATAHMSLLAGKGGGGTAASGTVTSMSAGGLSKSFSSVPVGDPGDAYWNKTVYGQFYLTMRDALPCAYVPLVLGC